MQKKNKLNSVDNLAESSFKNSIKSYFKSNSFFYNNLRKLKSLLYFKTGNDFFLNIVNDGTVVYGERPKTIFENYSNLEINKNFEIFVFWYFFIVKN